MIEVLEFIFSSFWRWLGTVILITSITGGVRYFYYLNADRRGR